MDINITQRPWWDYLGEDLQELFEESILLSRKVSLWTEKFHDYSFVVFPAAKAYEGYLKKLFLDMGFIDEGDYYGKHFRIGKALNPNLEPHLRNHTWVYKSLKDFSKSEEMPDHLWDAWRQSRNVLFHWFPNEMNVIDILQSHDRIKVILGALDISFEECRIELADRNKL